MRVLRARQKFFVFPISFKVMFPIWILSNAKVILTLEAWWQKNDFETKKLATLLFPLKIKTTLRCKWDVRTWHMRQRWQINYWRYFSDIAAAIKYWHVIFINPIKEPFCQNVGQTSSFLLLGLISLFPFSFQVMP